MLKSLKAGNSALKRMSEQMSLDDAEQIMADNAEGIEYANELSDILSQDLTDMDNDALDEELQALAGAGIDAAAPEEEAAAELPVMPTVPIQLPTVPTHEPAVEEPEQEEARQREAMAI